MRQRVVAFGIGGVVGGAALAFGGVHPEVMTALAIAATGVGLAALAVVGRPPSGVAALASVLLVLYLAAGGVTLIPVGSGVRAVLQPGLSEFVGRSLKIALGAPGRPLALEPRAALLSCASVAAALVLGMGACAAASRRSGSRVLAAVIATSGAAVSAVGIAQRVTGAESVLWISGVGATSRHPFFGTFVNQNHAAAFLVASACVAISGAAAGRRRAGFVTAAIASLLGLCLVTSRSSPVLLGVGLVVLGLLSGRPLLRRLAGGVVACLAVAALIIGPLEGIEAYTELFEPAFLRYHDVLSGRRQIWIDTIDLIARAPILGVGPGGFEQGFHVSKSTGGLSTLSHAHQDYLQVVVEHGWVGACLLLSAVGVVVGHTLRRLPAARGRNTRWHIAGYLSASAVIGTAAAFDFPMRAVSNLFLFCVCLGSAFGLADRLNPTERRRTPDRSHRSTSRSRARGRSGFTRSRRWFRITVAERLWERWVHSVAVSLLALGALFGATAWIAGQGTLGTVWGDADATLAEARVMSRVARRSDRQQDWARARALARRSLYQRPLDVQPLLELALISYARGAETSAVSQLELATEIHPTHPAVWWTLGRLHHKEGRLGPARSAYRQLLSLELSPAQARDGLREALAIDADPSQHIDDLLPARPDRRCEAARLLLRSGRREVAEDLYRWGAPRRSRCAVMWAEDLSHLDEHAAAVAALELAEDGCGSARIRGFSELAMGRYAAAERALMSAQERCLKALPRVDSALASARFNLDRPGALVALEGLLDEHPESIWAARFLARAYAERGRGEEGRAILGRLLDRGVATIEDAELFVRLEVELAQSSEPAPAPGGEE